MDSGPKISIIIPAWNSEETIVGCLDSLFNQTFKDFEVIVVNDGSTDKTLGLLEPFLLKIKLINQENRGSNPARNRGWKEAVGEYLFFLDSDVTLRPDGLAKLVDILDSRKDASYVYPSFFYGNKLFKLWPFDANRLRKMPCVHTGSLIRAAAFPGFDENIKRLQDWDLWLTMLERGKIGVWLPEALFKATPRSHGISKWVPRWFFWIPWRLIGWQPKRVESYLEAVRTIKEKHGL